jgi:hypothetical protein
MKTLTFKLLGCALLLSLAGQIRGQDNSRSTLKMIGLPFANPEQNPPSVAIDYPLDGQQVSQAVIQARVTATDDTRVEYFQFSLNGVSLNGPQADWAPGMPWPWGTSLTLTPGTNTFDVVCSDYWGNTASTSVTFVYVAGTDPTPGITNGAPSTDPPPDTTNAPNNELTLEIENGGLVTPNYEGKSLVLGQAYSMTARAVKGFRFDGWSGSVSNRRAKLTFVMQPNLLLSARFTDVSRPINIVMFPRANSTVRNTTVIATGRAGDNSAVTNVYYQLNGGGWQSAVTTNAWTTWETATLSPVSGRNVLESYAVDDSGLVSRTNRLRFKY